MPEIGFEILQKLPITSSEELRALYVELLYKSATKELVKFVHPRFIKTISEMAPEEARIINHVTKNQLRAIPFLKWRYNLKDGITKTPIFDYFPKQFDHLVEQNYFPLFMSNLTSLGIFTREEGFYREGYEEIYQEIEEKIKVEKTAQSIIEADLEKFGDDLIEQKPQYFRCQYLITHFGQVFLKSIS